MDQGASPAEKEGQDPSVREPLAIAGLEALAGGVEAYEEFFDQMPPTSGIAFVVLMHLSAERESVLAEVLSRHTAMPVKQVEGSVRMEADHVYVIPPGRILTIEKGVLHAVKPENPAIAHAPIDRFFRSLAEDQGSKAICVLLSGAGTDGTLGLRAIKEHGGLTIAQQAASARHEGIPTSAIATGLVDHVLEIHEMPFRLLEHVRYLQTVGNLTANQATDKKKSEALTEICSLLRRRKGHDYSQYKESTLLRRIQRRMQVVQAETMDAYVKILRESPAEQERLFSDLLIGVTHFFRDPDAFQSLAEQAIPKILENASPQGEIRACVAGCSTGEEIYSLAILLSEHLATMPADRRQHVKIFGTDIDEDAIEVARQGRYLEAIQEHVSPERLERFFIKQDGFYQVKREIREMCIFSLHSIIKDPPFSRLHLISCRNLLIYFSSEMQKRVIPLFHYALNPGGFLFLGTAENITAHTELFKAVDKKNRIYQRRDGLSRQPVTFPVTEFSTDVRTPPLPRKQQERNLATVVERNILRNYAPACVVVTERGEAIYFSGRTGLYLEPVEGEISLDIVSMAREGLPPSLRAALHAAVETRSEIVKENVVVRTNGGFHTIDLRVRPLRELGQDPGLLLVVFQEVSKERGKELTHAASAAEIDDAVAHLERELRSTRENLQTTIEELETSNEELKNANEELQPANEELQSSKEECHSLNEELETVNAELSGKVEELDRANSDLQNLLESTQIASIFLDSDLRIRGYTPAIGKVYRLLRSDIGRPITDFGQRFATGDLAEECRRVLRSLSPSESLIRRTEGAEWFRMRVLPYRNIDGAVQGVLITFMDVTEEKRAEEALKRMNEDLKQFAYAASHDLQEPLRMVVTFSQLLSEEYADKLDDTGKEYLSRAVNGALRVERLLRAMRQYWQAIEEPQDGGSLCDSEDALQEAIKNLESVIEESGATITHDALPEVACSRARMTQLFQNLIGNAIKYRGEEPPRVHIACHRAGNEWLFSVSDNGIGIEPRHLTRIFGVFRRLHGNQYPGEGIGLALCSKIVERCGGRIWADSEPGRGSTFHFALPVPKM